MNQVSLVGYIGTDPEIKTIGNGRKVCRFRLGVKSFGKDAKTDFFTVIAWERQAELVHQYATKGKLVSVEGRLAQSTWEKDGQKHERVEVVANRVGFLSTGGNGGGQAERGGPVFDNDIEDDNELDF